MAQTAKGLSSKSSSTANGSTGLTLTTTGRQPLAGIARRNDRMAGMVVKAFAAAPSPVVAAADGGGSGFVWKGAKIVPMLMSIAVGLVVHFIIPCPVGVLPQAWTLLAIFLSTITGEARNTMGPNAHPPANSHPRPQFEPSGRETSRLNTSEGPGDTFLTYVSRVSVCHLTTHIHLLRRTFAAGLVLTPLPVGAWAFLGLTVAVVTKTLTFQQAFSAMTNDVIWLIVLAFFFAKGQGPGCS